MTLDEYHDLWIAVLERHTADDDDWVSGPEAFLADWIEELEGRGLTEQNAVLLATKFFDADTNFADERWRDFLDEHPELTN